MAYIADCLHRAVCMVHHLGGKMGVNNMLEFLTSDKVILLVIAGGIIAAIRWAFLLDKETEEEDMKQ